MTVARIKYGKGSELKYISHLDFMRSFHRLLNRAGIEVAHSQGFNPHPRVSFAMAMPVGMTSEGEYLDVELVNTLTAETIKKELKKHAPKGLNIFDVKIYEDSLVALSAFISHGIFEVEIPLRYKIMKEDMHSLIKGIMDEEKIELERKNKKGKIVLKDIRPLIKNLEVVDIKENILTLKMVINIGSVENLNPQLLINYIKTRHVGFKENSLAKIHRVDMVVSGDRTPFDL